MAYRQTTNHSCIRRLALLTVLSLNLAACNSNDESATTSGTTPSNSTPNNPDILSGKVTGIQLSGLSYQTASQSGKTSAEGAFTYKAGESVSFFIGDIAAGQAIATPTITLFDMVGIAEPNTVTQGLQTKLKSTVLFDERNAKIFQFERLSNLLIFLTAIDTDGDFSNGVTVPSQLDAIAQGKTLDIIGKQIVEFERQLEDSNLLNEGVANGIWQTKPAIVSPGVALDAFYNSIGVVPEIYTVSKEQGDWDSDGVNDYAISHSFDEGGNRIRTHTQQNGFDNSVTSYAYDDSGNTIGFYYDDNNNGAVDIQQEWAFDATGREILNQRDSDGDGVFEDRHTNEREYYDTGIISFHKTKTDYYSPGTDSLVSSSTTIQKFDTHGRTVYSEHSSTDTFNNESSAASITYTFDTAGNLTKIEEDQGSDGIVNVIHNYQYNDSNQKVLAASDFDADGKLDSIKTSVYDLDKRELTVSYDNYADGVVNQADGIIDSVQITNYDSEFNKIRDRLDEDNDGSFEEETTWEFTYDAEGRMLSKNQVSATSPEENTLLTLTFDDVGRVLTRKIVSASPDSSYLYTYSYDEAGRQTSSTEDHRIDSVIDSSYSIVFHDSYGGYTTTRFSSATGPISVQSILYDERGNRIEVSYGIAGNNTEQHTRTMTYNSDDMLIKQSSIAEGFEHSTTEYQYDKQGELISRVTTDKMDPANLDIGTETYNYLNIKSWQAMFYRFKREWAN